MREKKSISDGFDGIGVLDKYEYKDFDYLQSITFGKQIVGLGEQTFRYCRRLRRIDVDEDNRCFSSIDGVLYDKNQEVLICYPANRIGSSFVVPSSVRRIESFAFSGASKLYELTLNEGLLELGDCAIDGCSNLTAIKLPQTLQNIGEVAFQGCASIREFDIPASLRYIHFPALPEHLEKITVDPENPVFTVVDNVLYSKDMTTLIRVPGEYCAEEFTVLPSVKRIEIDAFSCCKSISKIIVPDTVEKIGRFAFAWLNKNQTVVIPERLYKDQDRAFSPFSLSDAEFQTYS